MAGHDDATPTAPPDHEPPRQCEARWLQGQEWVRCARPAGHDGEHVAEEEEEEE